MYHRSVKDVIRKAKMDHIYKQRELRATAGARAVGMLNSMKALNLIPDYLMDLVVDIERTWEEGMK